MAETKTIKDIIPTLKRRNKVSPELQKVIRGLKKYQKRPILKKQINSLNGVRVSDELKKVIQGLKKYQKPINYQDFIDDPFDWNFYLSVI
ncbi:hypothetical protein KKA39_00745 [Patescibacteria group bacterium]|nr:hypothetical protein [Patescibacteria group bacterium]MBU1727827.1 hypothetical protein [Patescibacteria group bacterium]